MTALDLSAATHILTPPTAPFSAVNFGDIPLIPDSWSDSSILHPVTELLPGIFAIPRFGEDVSTCWSASNAFDNQEVELTVLVAVAGPINGAGTANWTPFYTYGGNFRLDNSGWINAYVHGESITDEAYTPIADTDVRVYAITNRADNAVLASTVDGVISSVPAITVADLSNVVLNVANNSDGAYLLGVWYFNGTSVSNADLLETADAVLAAVLGGDTDPDPDPDPDPAPDGFYVYQVHQADAKTQELIDAALEDFTPIDASITAESIGLGNVDNTSDEDKPVSTAQATALAGKAATSHSHAQSDITGLSTALSGKAASSHTHSQSDITGLATSLTSKADVSHSHAQSDITGLTSALAGKAAVSHSHAQSDITGLSAAFALKMDKAADPVVIGPGASATAPFQVAIGNGATVSADDAVAIGDGASATAFGAIVLGSFQATGTNAVALNGYAKADYACSLGGTITNSAHVFSVAIGAGATSTAANQTIFKNDTYRFQPRTASTQSKLVLVDAAGTDFELATTGSTKVIRAGELDELVRDIVGALLVEGTGMTITVDDAGNTITLESSGGGGGGTAQEIRHDNTGTYDYLGSAADGTAEGSSGWTVTRITLTSPPVIKTGTGTWTGRAGLTYA